MKPVTTSIGLALALCTSAAAAQYRTPAPQPQQAAPVAQIVEDPAKPKRLLKVSGGAKKALTELQTAVAANDTATIPAKIAAAEAVAKNNDDRYMLGSLRLQAAIAAKDNAGIASAIEAVLASGLADAAETQQLNLVLGKTYKTLGQHDKAAAALERGLAANPNNYDYLIELGETRVTQGQVGAGVDLIRKGIAARNATGTKAPEDWYRRAVALAYKGKLPVTLELSRDWVKAYPGPVSWRDSLRIYDNLAALDDSNSLDMLRLARATQALTSEAEFHRYAYGAFTKGYPGEAKAVIEEGGAAGKIDPKKEIFRDLLAKATAKAAGDRASLDAGAATARAGATAKPAVAIADAYFSYGDYAKAAELYRAALPKSGADADLINLHLGMALARQGDKAGATAALSAVAGPRAELAKYWLTYLSLGA
ncbi:tetratricopeptide repeat protein [Sphingomonas sp.]|uniref:tetratricopeptide repeat protein n=1 Tax=Sphingomonas sp. TaxID=28214 RepID=UPI00286DE20D|nr:tetratricopeptide repeat protein [Sphingomonas sp.]